MSDVIVVGTGPGGSTAAYELARRGARVTLLEQKLLPRYKPCGGCLSVKIEHILDLDFRPLVERTVRAATFTFEGLDEVRVESDRPVAYMVMRDRFDHFLAEAARSAGANLRTGERVQDVEETPDGVRVVTSKGEYRARYLVGGDGANGIVARRLNLNPRRRVAVCVEAEVETDVRGTETPGDEVRIEFGSIPFGYGWVFPKGDHWSIGVGGFRDKIDNPRALYDEFLVDQDLVDAITSERRKGYIIPVFAGATTALGTERVLLIGDAAALVDPFLGEGVYYAIRSGQFAAQCLADALSGESSVDTLPEYTTRVEEEIYREFRPARKLAFFMYVFPRTGYQVLKRRPAFVERYFEVLRGAASYADVWNDVRSVTAADLVRAIWPATTRARTVSDHYDRLARRYDAALRVWRTLVADAAWRAFGDLLQTHVQPGATVLDAGTGTGAAVQLLLERTDPASVVAVDLSKGMLREARKKIRDPRVSWEQQDITKLPYADRSFDVVTCTWTLETLPNPHRAVTEFLRVVKDDGHVVFCFSSRPATGVAAWYSRLLEEWSAGTLHGRFLAPREQPYHDCGHSRVSRFAGGTATLVVLRKCCRVDDPAAPCLPQRPAGDRLGAK